MSMIERVCSALDMSIAEFSKSSGIPFRELEPLIDPRMFTLEWQKDDTWWKIKEHIGQQIGMLMAVNADLDRQLQRDRTRQAMRHVKALERPEKLPPRQSRD